MYIVLPQKIDGLEELLAKVDSSTLHRAQYLLEEVEVKVALPKFKFQNSINLNEELKNVSADIWTYRIIFNSISRMHFRSFSAGYPSNVHQSGIIRIAGSR